MYILQMITTMSLVNIHHMVTMFFLVMRRTFKIYSLADFQICHIGLLTIVTVWYRECVFVITVTWKGTLLAFSRQTRDVKHRTTQAQFYTTKDHCTQMPGISLPSSQTPSSFPHQGLYVCRYSAQHTVKSFPSLLFLTRGTGRHLL